MQKARLYIVIIGVFIIAGCQSKRSLLDQVEQCIIDSNYNKAILICNEVLADDSTNVEAYYKRGYSLECLMDYKNAAENYSSSIHFNKNGWRGYLYRAILLCKQQHFEYSIPDFNAALSNAPSDSVKEIVLTDRGHTYATLRKFNIAAEDFKKALKYNPRNRYAMTGIGECLSETGKTRESVSYFEKAIEIDSAFEAGYVNLAFVYSRLDEHLKSIEINNKILAKRPNEPYALNNRGYSKMQLNDLAGAMEDINHSIQLAPGNSYAFRNRGLLYLKLAKNNEACADFQTALKLDFTRYYGNEVEQLAKKCYIK